MPENHIRQALRRDVRSALVQDPGIFGRHHAIRTPRSLLLHLLNNQEFMASYDVIFIGGGPAGYVGAIRCAQLGFNTAVIERE